MSVLMLHGAGGGAWEWNVWRRVFAAAGHEVQCPDLVPCAAGLEATRLADYAAQVEAVADASVEVVIGASLGGLLALQLAARRPCRALMLVNPLPPAPEAALLPPGARPARIAWGRDASLAGTRAALPDADAATWQYAFRRWRDESGAVVDEACSGIRIGPPACASVVIGSGHDDEIAIDITKALARRLESSFWSVPGSHVGPLLGRDAARLARQAVQWLNTLAGFRTD